MTRPQTLSLAVAAVLAALAAGWMLGRADRGDAPAAPASTAPANERKPLYYRNPMGLPDTSPVPKKDAMGMDYIPVYADDAAPAAAGTVVVSPQKLQTLGVRTEPVRRSALASLVRASGTVEVDETRQYAIAPRFEGWVATLYANQTGMRVRAGQPLLAVYSPQLAAAQQEYRLADAAAQRLASSDPASAASMLRLRDAARARLRNWEVDGAHRARRSQHGGNDTLVLTSPADATVIEKPVVQGARFEAGETILRLADLSVVWVQAKVPAAQATAIAVGQPARFESTTLPGRRFDGEVKFVQPLVDAATRTVDVRIVFPNPDGDLRPGLYGTVWLEQPVAAPVLSVPRSAVLDSGTRQLVLVQTGPGRFAPRAVTTGRRAGERVEILAGLAQGEEVVVAANFLIDAESNLQSALQGLGGDHAGHAMPAAAAPGAATDAAAEKDAGGDHGNPGASARPPGTGRPASASHSNPGKPVVTPAAVPHDGHGADAATEPAAPQDPHADHGTSAAMAPVAPRGPHAGHGATDPHAGHGAIDPHAGHGAMSGPAPTGDRDPHEGH
ncbi:efflux RND transporter periplasmic adaptor subunit [Cognatiluteimonas weifangensis]|uniref:efflux RND transporter periplasmic adaptor subunit n=1 Tax=Cognatiluteimonas weifangensis TaxID=2303539 RepID=UPI001F42BDBC|nr:efflux RND transporter periplasmic adaptor subunit [Luteimonas weifangensis]